MWVFTNFDKRTPEQVARFFLETAYTETKPELDDDHDAKSMVTQYDPKKRENMNQEQLKKDDERIAREKKEMQKVVAVFEKLKNSQFQLLAPKPFPWQNFSIDYFCDRKLVDDFFTRYADLEYKQTSNKAKRTHVVVQTNKRGVFNYGRFTRRECDSENPNKRFHKVDKVEDVANPDGVEYITAVLSPMIMVSHKWLEACMKDEANFYKEHEYRVTKFQYHGKLYKTVDTWKKWIRGDWIPLLFNAGVHLTRPFAVSMNLTTIDYTDDVKDMFRMLGVRQFYEDRHARKEIEKAVETKQAHRLYYDHGKKGVIIPFHNAWTNLPSIEGLFKKQTVKKLSIMPYPELFKWLLSIDGPKSVEMKEKKDQSNEKVEPKVIQKDLKVTEDLFK